MPCFATGMAPGYAGNVSYVSTHHLPSTQAYSKDITADMKMCLQRTHSIPGPFSPGVFFERNIDLSPPTDDEIIIATVRVRSGFRRLSGEEGACLPER